MFCQKRGRRDGEGGGYRGSCLLPSFHTVFEMPQKERENARVERINEQHKHEWLNSGGTGGRRLLKRRERWKTDTILLSRSEPGVDFTLAMTHSHGRSCHGAKGVEEGEEWADVRVHSDRRPYGPWGTNKVPWQKGALLSSRILLKPLWEFSFAVPPFLCRASHFSASPASSRGMCLLQTSTRSGIAFTLAG